MLNFSDPKFWVSAAFVILVVLSAKTVAKFLAGFLDAHSAKVKSELEAASRLRAEAEATLALYKQKQAEFSKEAETLLSKARSDAEAYGIQAQKDLKAALDVRLKQALEKIEQEEKAAIAEVRNHVVDMTINAARSIVSEQMDSSTQKELIKRAISDIGRKIH